MTEEYLDIVDENSNLTGEKELRSIVHEKGLWHRTVHIYVYQKQENEIQLLVHLRSKFKDSNPNKWDTRFGGHIKAGDTPEKSTLDELNEEIGLTPDSERLKFVEIYKYDGSLNKEFCYTSLYDFNEDVSDLKYNDGEVQEVKWMTFEEIEKDVLENPSHWTSSHNGILELKNLFEDKIFYK